MHFENKTNVVAFLFHVSLLDSRDFARTLATLAFHSLALAFFIFSQRFIRSTFKKRACHYPKKTT